MLCGWSMSQADGLDHARRLWILEQIIQTRSIRQAALRARVTPPAVSQAVSVLERTLGKPLLIRGKQSVEPTPEALALVQQASPALQTIANLMRTAASPVPNLKWLSFGTYESLAISLFPMLVSSLKTDLPDLKLTTRIARSGALAQMIRQGELCAALVAESDDFGRLRVEPLATDRLGLYVKKGTAFDAQTRLGTLSPGQDGLPRYFQKFQARVLGPARRPDIVSDSFEVLRATAAQGVAAAILPERVALRETDDLEEIALPGLEPSLGVHRIVLLSTDHCDEDEVRFLSTRFKTVLRERGYACVE